MTFLGVFFLSDHFRGSVEVTFIQMIVRWVTNGSWGRVFFFTLPETNIARENPIFPCKYHQNGGFSMAMLVSGRVSFKLFAT